MKIKLIILFSCLVITINSYGQEKNKVTSADTNDYIECAAFYTSASASLKLLGAENNKITLLKERSAFYLRTAIIYNEPKLQTSEIKSQFLIKNKEYTASAFKMLNGSDKEIYPSYMDAKISECKDMLNINMMALIKKQGIQVK